MTENKEAQYITKIQSRKKVDNKPSGTYTYSREFILVPKRFQLKKGQHVEVRLSWTE